MGERRGELILLIPWPSDCQSYKCQGSAIPTETKGIREVLVKVLAVQLLGHVWFFAAPCLQHARLPYPSPSPGVCSDSGPLSKSREDIKKERRGVKDLVWDRVVGRGAWKEGPGWGRMERGWGWGWSNLEDSQRRKRDQKSPPPPIHRYLVVTILGKDLDHGGVTWSPGTT